MLLFSVKDKHTGLFINSVTYSQNMVRLELSNNDKHSSLFINGATYSQTRGRLEFSVRNKHSSLFVNGTLELRQCWNFQSRTNTLTYLSTV